MSDLDALIIFARVAEAGSLSQAARRSGVPVSTISRRLAELETRLGARLLERSTRSLRLTEIGGEILEHAQRGVESADAIAAIVANRATEVRGVLRLSAPPNLSDSLLAPMIGAFQAAYPAVEVHVLVTERLVDLIVDGVDLAIRLGPLADSTHVARPLLRYRHRLLAGPDYLRGRPAPRRPADLAAHRLLAFSFWSQPSRWTFERPGEKRGARETIAFRPALAMNDYGALAAALISGRGIGELPAIVAPELVADGRLVEVMPAWRFSPVELSLVHLGNRHATRPLRLFMDVATDIARKLFPELAA